MKKNIKTFYRHDHHRNNVKKAQTIKRCTHAKTEIYYMRPRLCWSLQMVLVFYISGIVMRIISISCIFIGLTNKCWGSVMIGSHIRKQQKYVERNEQQKFDTNKCFQCLYKFKVMVIWCEWIERIVHFAAGSLDYYYYWNNSLSRNEQERLGIYQLR